MIDPMSPLFLIDFYKADHRRQYPQGTEYVYSNFTPRSTRIPHHTKVVLAGLQYFLKRYLGEIFDSFFTRDIEEVCAEYEQRMLGALGPNGIGSEHIRQLHGLGYLPLEIRALPEGTKVPLRVPMFTVENTHPDFAWLVNYLETIMSSVLWMPCTSATTAMHYRQILDAAAERTGSSSEFVDWQGHDFSFRGMPGPEAAMLSDLGHLLFFTGTDTVPTIGLIERYYPVADPDYMIGGSVAATEHSVMCAGGDLNEMETFERLLDLYPTGIVSIVSDTWNLWDVLTKILPALKDRILAREGKVVIRPDTGDPVKIICGDPDAELDAPAHQGVIELLYDVFGGTKTDAGYIMLDPHVGCIYGDSITEKRAELITDGLADRGFASGNMVFGIGSFTYQHVTRDTYGFAMKATWCQVDGEGRDIFKDPITDDGVKKSAKGRLAVIEFDGELTLIEGADTAHQAQSLLRPVWRDGQLLVDESYETIRARARG